VDIILATEHHSHLTTTKLYCSVREAVCEQFAQSHYMKVEQPGVSSHMCIQHTDHYTRKPQSLSQSLLN